MEKQSELRGVSSVGQHERQYVDPRVMGEVQNTQEFSRGWLQGAVLSHCAKSSRACPEICSFITNARIANSKLLVNTYA